MIVLIDGPSGSGKTTFAGFLGEILGMRIVHFDDLYPGWHGLAAGVEIVTALLEGAGGYHRWDWENDTAGPWVEVSERNLIIEGVGSLAPSVVRAARQHGSVLTMLFDGPEQMRRQRALARDPFYEPWWDMWAAQEARHFATVETPDVTRVFLAGAL